MARLMRLRALWLRIHEPRIVSVLRFLMYLGFIAGGLSAVATQPNTLQGETGSIALTALASLLSFGGVLGAIAALPGVWWLERVALLAIIVSATIYGSTVIAAHIAGRGGNLLHLSFIFAVILSQFIRWARIKNRPYDPDLRTITTDVS